MPDNKHKSQHYNAIVCYFYLLNYCLSSGFLTLPFVYYYAGTFPSIFLITFLGITGCITALWVLEIMGRCRVLNQFRLSGTTREVLCLNSSNGLNECNEDIYTISEKRKFEMTDMCKIMFGSIGRFVFIIIFCSYGILALWCFASVVGTSLSIYIPLNGSVVRKCNETEFAGVPYPQDPPCFNLYRVSVSVFGIIVTLLSLLELNEQKYIQLTFTLLRFLAFSSIIIFSVYLIIHNAMYPPLALPPRLNATASHSLTTFNIKWVLVAIPVIVYTQNMHAAIPSITHCVSSKKRLKLTLITTFATLWCIFLVLGIVASFALRNAVNENVTLNWRYFTESRFNIAVRIISFFITIFPSIDTVSAYPLVATTLSNNLYSVLMCRDTFQAVPNLRSRFGKMVFRFCVAFFPITGALFVSNLVSVLHLAGLFAFVSYFAVPIACQYQSKRLCSKLERLMGNSESVITNLHQDRMNNLLRTKHFLFNTQAKTPYSGWYSSNFVVIVIGLIALAFTGLSIGSSIAYYF